MSRRPEVRAELVYPEHRLKPEDLLHFVELRAFTQHWARLELDVEHDLLALQILIMSNPTGPPVVEGTGGLRKLRFAPAKWHTGRRGAARVCYVYFQEFGIVLLVTVYDKQQKGDLSADEKKKIRKLIAQAEAELERRGRLS